MRIKNENVGHRVIQEDLHILFGPQLFNFSIYNQGLVLLNLYFLGERISLKLAVVYDQYDIVNEHIAGNKHGNADVRSKQANCYKFRATAVALLTNNQTEFHFFY